jgi:hypothetical protein
MKLLNIYYDMGTNEIKWANDISLEKDCMSFCPNFFFSYNWVFEQFCLQIVIINAYNYLGRWNFLDFFLISMKIWKCANSL